MDIRLKPEHLERTGAEHLLILVKAAAGDTGQAGHVRRFLLHLFNRENPLDLMGILRALDRKLAGYAIDTLKLRMDDNKEPQEYFIDGDQLFQAMWRIEHPENRQGQGR